MLEPTERPLPCATPTGCGSAGVSSPTPRGPAALLDEVLQLSRFGMWGWTVGSGHVQHNDDWYALLGIGPGAVDDTVEGFKQLVYPPDRAAVSARVADLLQGRTSEYHSGHRMVTPYGIVRVRDRGGIAERGPDGQAVRVPGCITDITASRLRETELAEQRRGVDDTVGATGIANFEWDSRSDAVVLDEQAVAMGTNRQALPALLNDILDFSKVEAGRIDFEHIPLWPASLLEDTRSLFASLARDKGLGLEVCWHGPGDAAYRGDPGRLRQMLNNLVSNAIKFSSAGTVRLEARPLFESSGDGKTVLEFRVTDQGIGIAPEKQAQLFRPFSQVDASTTRRYGGTGLGLSIVKGLSELMGGDTGVHSRPGKGSAFWFTAALQPCAAGREGTEALPSAARSVEDAPLPADARLLVVEDHPANRYIIAHMLQRCGLTPEIAVHGQAAVDLIRLGRDFDLILMDVEMPVLDGYQATQAIRAVEADRAGGHHHAIIALTANAFPMDW